MTLSYCKLLNTPTSETTAITAPSMVSTVRVSQQRMGLIHTGTNVHGATATITPKTRRIMYRIASSFIQFHRCYVDVMSIVNV